jgi:hypothetical protein
VDKELPYELRALEAALFATVKVLEAETNVLEGRALPSLASLAQKVRLHHLLGVARLTSVFERILGVIQCGSKKLAGHRA